MEIKIKGIPAEIIFENDEICNFKIKADNENTENMLSCYYKKADIKNLEFGQLYNMTIELSGRTRKAKNGNLFTNNLLYLIKFRKTN